MFFERYGKKVMEPFAISVIARSFDSRYADYTQPENTDDFDFVSPDGLHAVEVVSIIPENEKNAYEYELQLSKGKTELRKNRIKDAVFKEDGSFISYYGGSFHSIITMIRNTVENKCNKAKRRAENHYYETIDLCVCVQDGSLMDLRSYQLANFDFSDVPFDNIFFITPSYFFRYSKASSFQEYLRKL